MNIRLLVHLLLYQKSYLIFFHLLKLAYGLSLSADKQYEYNFSGTKSETEEASWTDVVNPTTTSVSITINAEGEKYLHVIAHDNAGNVSEDTVLGPYKIDLSKPEVKSIVPVQFILSGVPSTVGGIVSSPT